MNNPHSIVSKRLKERKENVAEHLKHVGNCVSSLHEAEDCLNGLFSNECQRIEDEMSLVIESLERRKVTFLRELEAEKDKKLVAIAMSVQYSNEIILKTEDAIEKANILEAECDQSRFFARYSSVNTMLEERFVDLLLLSSHIEMDAKLDISGSFDLSGVMTAIERMPSSKLSGVSSAETSTRDRLSVDVGCMLQADFCAALSDGVVNSCSTEPITLDDATGEEEEATGNGGAKCLGKEREEDEVVIHDEGSVGNKKYEVGLEETEEELEEEAVKYDGGSESAEEEAVKYDGGSEGEEKEAGKYDGGSEEEDAVKYDGGSEGKEESVKYDGGSEGEEEAVKYDGGSEGEEKEAVKYDGGSEGEEEAGKYDGGSEGEEKEAVKYDGGSESKEEEAVKYDGGSEGKEEAGKYDGGSEEEEAVKYDGGSEGEEKEAGKYDGGSEEEEVVKYDGGSEGEEKEAGKYDGGSEEEEAGKYDGGSEGKEEAGKYDGGSEEEEAGKYDGGSEGEEKEAGKYDGGSEEEEAGKYDGGSEGKEEDGEKDARKCDVEMGQVVVEGKLEEKKCEFSAAGPNQSCGEVSNCVTLEELKLMAGMSLEVYVIEVLSPYYFVVQPQGTELVAVMQSMGENTCTDEETYGPCVGEYCCAQFSEDSCWYRAKVLDIFPGQDQALQALVLYVDYGNKELLLYSDLHRLDPKFCELPYQAIVCDLFNTWPSDSSSDWTKEVCKWFTNLLLGMSLKVSIVSCSSPNTVSLEAFLPTSHLMDSIATNFDPSKDFSQIFLSLTSFMHHVGLSKRTGSRPESLSISGVVAMSNPHARSVDQNHDETFFPTISDIPPLVIHLNESNEFTCLLSHVSMGMFVYVHPAQVDVAQSIMVLNDTLQSHYSVEENRIAIATGYLRSGRVCIVFSGEFQEWCRAVIVALHDDLSSGDKLSCLVFYIDFGGSVWVDSSEVYTLNPVLCTYPAQVICCGLLGSKGNQIDAASPRRNSDITRTHFFGSVEQEKLASECVRSVSVVIENKLLVAVVMFEMDKVEMGVVLSTRVDHTLPLKLYDTTGDANVCVNDLVKDALSQLHHSSKPPEGCLQTWNPMEEDFLSGRNQYKINDNDVGMALGDGFETTGRVCRFFNTARGCYRGDACPYHHLQQGVSNRQLVHVMVKADNHLELPRCNDWVVVIVTAVVSATRFYIQLPLGRISPLSLSQGPLPKQESTEELDFYSMVEDMTSYYNQQVFTEREVVVPNTGEIVAVHYPVDSCWYRARVIDSQDNKILVFFCDYGDMGTITCPDIRTLKEEYLVLPFQAVECYLPYTEVSRNDIAVREHARNCLVSYVQDKVLVAKIIAVEGCEVLGVELYSVSDGDTPDLCINQQMVSSGVLAYVTSTNKAAAKVMTSPTQLCMRPG